MKKMNIGILGSGSVAQTLASGFLKKGYPVMLGTRDPAKLKAFTLEHAEAKIGSFADAATFGELLVLAVKGAAALDCLNAINAEALKGKILIDTTNPIADAPPVNGVLPFFTTLADSLMERIQRAHPEVLCVKAWNTIGNAFMVDPQFKEGTPTMFICGNNASAKACVSEILKEFGFEPLDYGFAESARAIEPLCMLWCLPGFLNNDWSHALKMLQK